MSFHDFSALPRLAPHMFARDLSAQQQGISHGEVFAPGYALRNGWRAVGWIPGHKLMQQRAEELPEGSVWVGVRYEHENGEATWFHEIADAADLPTFKESK